MHTPDPITWCTIPNNYPDNESTSSYANNFTSDNFINKLNYDHKLEKCLELEEKTGHQRGISQSKVRPTPRRNADNPHNDGHIKSGNLCPSDIFPYTCTILNQNINGLENKNDRL